ncbi:hypothetical protein EJD97_008527, partial [Solanum chilense]
NKDSICWKFVKTRLGRRTSRRIVVVTTDRHGLRKSHTCAISSAALFITLDGKYDGLSQAQRFVEGLRSKTLELLNMGTRITSLNFTTNLQNGPSWTRRTIISSAIPHLVRLPHLPSAAALGCHLQTVTSMTDRHKLR